MTNAPKRRRRSPQTARDEILDAAENILLHQGPADLKFQEIATTAKIAKSTAHHHFGSLEEIHKALVNRVLERLTNDLAEALSHNDTSPEQNIEQALQAVYAIIASERYAKILAWIVLSTQTTKLSYLVEPLETIRNLVSDKLTKYMPEPSARNLAPQIVYQVAITAIGEGLIGKILQPILTENDTAPEGKNALNEMVFDKIAASWKVD
ncbi:TetR/AcrR family transcriptional regulator [Parasphingorhabdus sp.]|uniref:TetR/AcrR family transcriptional regulator n=1 Tax=Parasphingorhabdus sp. TaxID=2709688 RepID=UPI002F934A3D